MYNILNLLFNIQIPKLHFIKIWLENCDVFEVRRETNGEEAYIKLIVIVLPATQIP